MSNPKDHVWLLHIKNKIQEKTIKIQKLNEQLKILHTEIDTLNDIIRPTDILSIEDALPLANTAFLGYGSPLGDTSPLGDISPPDVLVKLIEEISIDSITDKSDIIKKNWGSYSTSNSSTANNSPFKKFYQYDDDEIEHSADEIQHVEQIEHVEQVDTLASKDKFEIVPMRSLQRSYLKFVAPNPCSNIKDFNHRLAIQFRQKNTGIDQIIKDNEKIWNLFKTIDNNVFVLAAFNKEINIWTTDLSKFEASTGYNVNWKGSFQYNSNNDIIAQSKKNIKEIIKEYDSIDIYDHNLTLVFIAPKKINNQHYDVVLYTWKRHLRFTVEDGQSYY